VVSYNPSNKEALPMVGVESRIEVIHDILVALNFSIKPKHVVYMLLSLCNRPPVLIKMMDFFKVVFDVVDAFRRELDRTVGPNAVADFAQPDTVPLISPLLDIEAMVPVPATSIGLAIGSNISLQEAPIDASIRRVLDILRHVLNNHVLNIF
jgi:hypothetical protein